MLTLLIFSIFCFPPTLLLYSKYFTLLQLHAHSVFRIPYSLFPFPFSLFPFPLSLFPYQPIYLCIIPCIHLSIPLLTPTPTPTTTTPTTHYGYGPIKPITPQWARLPFPLCARTTTPCLSHNNYLLSFTLVLSARRQSCLLFLLLLPFPLFLALSLITSHFLLSTYAYLTSLSYPLTPVQPMIRRTDEPPL